MSAIAAKGGPASMDMPSTLIGLVLFIILLGLMFVLGPISAFYALIGVVVGGVLIGFGVHFVPVGGAPAAMGQAPGIATGVAMLAAGAGLAGLFGGAWAAGQGTVIAVLTGGVGGGMLMAITGLMVNAIYVYGMGIPAASGKVTKDPLTGDLQAAYKSQGTEGHGLPFVSYVGGVIGGFFGGAGGTLIYLELLGVYEQALPALFNAKIEQIMPLAVALAGTFAVGMFLVNSVLAAYNITGTIEGPHDPKFKRFPRAIVASMIASALCGLFAILLVVMGKF